MPENKHESDQDKEYINSVEIQSQNPVKSVKKSIQKMVRGVILRLRMAGLSYSQIGEKINLGKGQVQMLEKGTWYPKTIKTENKLLVGIYGEN